VDLGLIVPPTNTVNEAEWRRALAATIGLHVARMPLHDDVTSETGRRTLISDLAATARELIGAGADAIAYGCTAGSLITPPDWLPTAMREAIGRPCAATAPALVAAARRLGVRRVAVATPYHDALNAHEAEFLTACGLEVVAIRGLGIGAGGAHEYVQIARLAPERVERLARDTAALGGDALMLSCTDLATLAFHDKLERALARPVISSNQATLWACLRAAGHDAAGMSWGALMKH
jgi:maleate cis-trans isomerase